MFICSDSLLGFKNKFKTGFFNHTAVPSGSFSVPSGSSIHKSKKRATMSYRVVQRLFSAVPVAPRVGVAAVVFARLSDGGIDVSRVLMVQRGKEPGAGLWAFPGGKLKAGETVAVCATRETLEETGLHVEVPQRLLFTAHDSIHRCSASGELLFHYVVAHVLGYAVGPPTTLPVAATDASAAAWVAVEEGATGADALCVDGLHRAGVLVAEVRPVLAEALRRVREEAA